MFTDRGAGMYTPQGFIVRDYEFALSGVGLQPFWGADATSQAPDMPDVLLHETAVGMFRNLLRKEKPAVKPWKESVEQWQQRAEKCIRHMNSKFDLQGLCRRFPRRLRKLEEAKGERLRV